MAPLLRRVLLILAGLVLLGGALYWAFSPQPVPVDLAPVSRGTLEVTVTDEGRTRIRDVYTVSAPVAGAFQRLEGRVGDRVTAGETVVARIRPSAPAFLDIRSRMEAEAALAVATAAVSLADAQHREALADAEFARADLTRNQILQGRNAVSERTLEESRLAFARAEARVASAEAALEMRRRERDSAAARLVGPDTAEGQETGDCCVAVTAPVDGEILAIHHESEMVVAAGTPLVEIGDPRGLEIVADFLSSDAVRIPPSASAQIEGWGGAPLEARVARVEPAGFTKVSALGIEEQRVRVVLDLLTPAEAWRGLGHAYRVLVRVTVERHEDVLLLPLGALFRQGAEWAVFVVDGDGRAELRIVETGARNARHGVVVAGLVEGERVILHPSDRIAAGTAVEARE